VPPVAQHRSRQSTAPSCDDAGCEQQSPMRARARVCRGKKKRGPSARTAIISAHRRVQQIERTTRSTTARRGLDRRRPARFEHDAAGFGADAAAVCRAGAGGICSSRTGSSSFKPLRSDVCATTATRRARRSKASRPGSRRRTTPVLCRGAARAFARWQQRRTVRVRRLRRSCRDDCIDKIGFDAGGDTPLPLRLAPIEHDTPAPGGFA